MRWNCLPKILHIIFLSLILASLTGCIGFINAYLADCFDSKCREVRAKLYPAVRMDTIYWKKFTSDTFNPVYVVLVTADFPISLVADTLFLPFVL